MKLVIFFFSFFFLHLFELSTSCGDYAHLFTKKEYEIISSKPVRKEVRDLTDEEWDGIVDVMWKMKLTYTEEGLDLDPYYQSYDRLTSQHITCTSDPVGDQGHGIPSFILYHRAMMLQFDRAMRMFRPDLLEKGISFPYWNWYFDNKDTDSSIIWSDRYFGDRNGDADALNQVTNGRFAFWPIRKNDDSIDTLANVTNAYGYLRSPLVPLKNPYVTRYGGQQCTEFKDYIGEVKYFDDCLHADTNISNWQYCIDGTIHSAAHQTIGGFHQLYPNNGGSDNCDDWENSHVWIDGLQTSNFVEEYGCFDYVTCDDSQPIEECMPYLTGKCKVDGSTVDLESRENIAFAGDFRDVTASPNDPVFPFHHINMDRHFSIWQIMNYESQPYYGYPLDYYGYGGKLDDILNHRDPFVNIYGFPDSLKDTPLTARDILDNTFFVDLPYVYDDILALIDREGCNFDDDDNFRQVKNDKKRKRNKKNNKQSVPNINQIPGENENSKPIIREHGKILPFVRF